MNNREKKELIQEIKELEKFKYIIIQKINKLVFGLEKILIGE